MLGVHAVLRRPDALLVAHTRLLGFGEGWATSSPVVESVIEGLTSAHPYPHRRAQLITARPVVTVTVTIVTEIIVDGLGLLAALEGEQFHANSSTVLVGEEPVEGRRVR